MKKVKSTDSIYYYEINTEDFLYSKPLFIGIDKKEEKLYFLTEKTTSKPTYILDLNKPSFLEKDDLLPVGLVFRIYKKVLQAVKVNDFGDYIVYSA